MTDKAKYTGLALLSLGIVALALLIAFGLSYDAGERLVREGGPVESLSVLLYLAVVGAFWLKFGMKAAGTYWYVLAALLAFMLRELDAHKAFTTMSIFKSRFYLSGDVPVWEKFLGFAVIVFLIYVAYLLISRHLATFIKNLRNFEPSAIAVFFAMGCAGVAKSLDGIGRKLADFGISIPVEDLDRFEIIEEVLELGIGLLLIYAVFVYVKGQVSQP